MTSDHDTPRSPEPADGTSEAVRRAVRSAAVQRAENLELQRRVTELTRELESERQNHAKARAAEDKRRRTLERQLDAVHASFTWKAGSVVKGALVPAAGLARRLRKPGSTKPAPKTSAPTASVPSSPRPTTQATSDQDLSPALDSSALRTIYEREASQQEFGAPGQRRIAFAAYTLDFDRGRGDLYVAVGIGRELRKLGIDVVYRDSDDWYRFAEAPDDIIAMIPTFRPSQLPPDLRSVAWIRNEVDNWLDHPELHLFDAIVCSSERSRAAVAKVYAGPTGVLPIGVDTELFHPGAFERRGVVSTANQWGRERDVNRALRDQPITFPLAIHGHTRGLADVLHPYAKGPTSYFLLPSLYQQVRIVLDDFNFTTVAWGNVNSRLYESLAAGALPITNTSRGLADLGLDDVPTFSSPSELNPLIARLLADEEGTAALVDRLSGIVRTQHGFDRRAGELRAFLDQLDDSTLERRTVVGFFPDYRVTNPYQDMLYGQLSGSDDAIALPVELDAIASDRAPFFRTAGRQVFHLHWTAPILGPAANEDAARTASRTFLERLDRFIEDGGTFIWTLHNVLPHECRFPDIESELRQGIVDRAHRVHIMCAASVAAAAAHFSIPDNKVKVIPHSSFIGVYPDAYARDRARTEMGLADTDIALLALGGIRPYKGIDRLLDAFDEALSHEPNLRLILAGKPGHFAGATELESRAAVHPRIISNFTAIPDDELQVFFKASDVVVLPHRAVLNSGALLLAYTFGRPVVAPATGCLPTVLNADAALSFDPADDRSLRDALVAAGSLATHEARLAARRVAESYQPADMAGDYAVLVTEAIEAARSMSRPDSSRQ